MLVSSVTSLAWGILKYIYIFLERATSLISSIDVLVCLIEVVGNLCGSHAKRFPKNMYDIQLPKSNFSVNKNVRIKMKNKIK
jgi:hypothetical protein